MTPEELPRKFEFFLYKCEGLFQMNVAGFYVGCNNFWTNPLIRKDSYFVLNKFRQNGLTQRLS